MAPGSQAVGYSSLSPKEARPITLIQIQRAAQFPSSQNALSTKGNTGPARGRPGNQVINNHHGSGGRQRRSTDGASQVRYAPAMTADICTWLRDEEASGSPRSTRHSAILAVRRPALSRLSSPTVRLSVRLLRCRIKPYWIKAAPLRSAAPGHARTGLRPWGPTRHGAPGNERASTDRIGSSAAPTTSQGVSRLPRLVSVPVAATASRAPAASHAIATRPLTRRPLTRDSAPMRKIGEK